LIRNRGLSFRERAFAVTHVARGLQCGDSGAARGSFEMRKSLAVVLAAGEGKRMKSRLPKVLHEIGRLPMIAHVLRALNEADVDRIAVVIGPGHEAVAKVVEENASGASIHTQTQQRGTGDAVKAARLAIEVG